MTSSAFATNYYVATWGSDSNPGTSAAPWRTLQWAVDHIAAGDTILVASGSYVGCRITHSGAAGSPSTLKADVGASVLVNAEPPTSTRHSFIEAYISTSQTVNYWVIDHLEVSGSGGYGVDLHFTSNITVQNCYVHNSSITGLYSSHGPYTSFLNNETSANGEHGIYHCNSADYPTIRGNLSHDNSKAGVHMNGDLSQGGNGLIYYPDIEKNAIYNNDPGNAASALNLGAVWYGTIFNNLCYNNHDRGISLYDSDGASGSSYNKVYCNTFVSPSDSNDIIVIPASSKKKPNPVGNLVKDNILYTANTGAKSLRVYGSGALATGGSDYNAVIDRFSINGGKNTINLTTWRTYGFDAHSFLSTPTALFVDPANNNYHLKSGSPAANAGTTLSEVTTDLLGVTRPQGSAYDIGCYEDW